MSALSEISNLTTRIKRGDPAAIEEFYNEYFDLMFREAQRAIEQDEASCLDVVQDSMLKLLKSIKVMNTPEQLRGWTRKLVRSVAIDCLRKRQARLRREQSRQRSNRTESPTELELNQARLLWLEESLDEMDEDSRNLLTLRYRLGWTLQRIADSLGLKPGAVDGRISRLVEQLRHQAEAHDE